MHKLDGKSRETLDKRAGVGEDILRLAWGNGARPVVLGDVAGARARAVQAGAEYRAAVVAAVDMLERAGARDAFSRVAEAAGVSRQTVRTLVGRARADS